MKKHFYLAIGLMVFIALYIQYLASYPLTRYSARQAIKLYYQNLARGNLEKAEVRSGYIPNGKEGKQEAIYAKELNIEKTDDKVKISATTDNWSRGPVYDIRWLDQNNFRFTYSNGKEKTTFFYIFDTAKGKLKSVFKINGDIWNGETVLDGKAVLYAENGFTGLNILNENGEVRDIMITHSWYHISPDGKKIVIEGRPTRTTPASNSKRYIFDINMGSLVEAPYIPSMEYVFSFIAARWSPDSIHISSQMGDMEESLNIINALENKIIKEIVRKGSKISFPKWSPDGKLLVFMVQSPQNKTYTYEAGEMYFYMSDILGIFNTKDNSVKFINMKDGLIADDFLWGDNSQEILLQTISVKKANEFRDIIRKSAPGRTIEKEINILDLATEKLEPVVKSEVTNEEGIINTTINPIRLFDNRILLSSTREKETSLLTFLDLRNGKKQVIDNLGNLPRSYIAGQKIYIVISRGIYSLDKELNLELILDFNSQEKDLVHLDAFLSPDYGKAVIIRDYQPNSGKKSYIEVVKLSGNME